MLGPVPRDPHAAFDDYYIIDADRVISFAGGPFYWYFGASFVFVIHFSGAGVVSRGYLAVGAGGFLRGYVVFLFLIVDRARGLRTAPSRRRQASAVRPGCLPGPQHPVRQIIG